MSDREVAVLKVLVWAFPAALVVAGFVVAVVWPHYAFTGGALLGSGIANLARNRR